MESIANRFPEGGLAIAKRFLLEDDRCLTDHRQINTVIDYIGLHYDQDISVKFLARYVSLEETYLSRLFKTKRRENLIQFLHQTRVKQAKRLLEGTDLKINEIGCRVGYVNENYFFRMFKRYAGTTPSDYRKLAAKTNS